MRTILEFPAENAKSADWLADGAVWCELLSALDSLIIRENTGNFRDFGCLGLDLHLKKPHLPSGFCRNSLLNRTGNYFRVTGNLICLSGNFLGRTGKTFLQLIRRDKLGEER